MALNNRIKRNIFSMFYNIPVIGAYEIPSNITKYLDQLKESLEYLNESSARYKLINTVLCDIKKYHVSFSELHSICIEANNYSETIRKGRIVKPIVRRDNKDVINGIGIGDFSSVRYPRKSRSLQTWKKFYALFPALAKKDNWDGRTSDKMK